MQEAGFTKVFRLLLTRAALSRPNEMIKLKQLASVLIRDSRALPADTMGIGDRWHAGKEAGEWGGLVLDDEEQVMKGRTDLRASATRPNTSE